MSRKAIWYSFKPMNGQDEIIARLIEKRSIIEKPALSEDQINKINENLTLGANTKEKIYIEYFENEKILTEEGIIEELNQNKKYIIINNIKIYLITIINIDI